MTATIEDTEAAIIDEFAMFDDTFDKFGYLIDMGKEMTPMDPALKTADRLIKGCQAQVWLSSELRDGKVYFQADADADYAKGLVAMMVRVLSGHTPAEIVKAPLKFIETIGFANMLSMKRAGGLASMIKQMKLDALVYQAKAKE